MGCDIHAAIVLRTDYPDRLDLSPYYRAVVNFAYEERNYTLFGLIAGVRCDPPPGGAYGREGIAENVAKELSHCERGLRAYEWVSKSDEKLSKQYAGWVARGASTLVSETETSAVFSYVDAHSHRYMLIEDVERLIADHPDHCSTWLRAALAAMKTYAEAGSPSRPNTPILCVWFDN